MKYLGFIWRVLRRLVWETATDQTTGLAAQMAYLLLFRSEEHTSELQSQSNLVCRLLLEKKKKTQESARSALAPQRWNVVRVSTAASCGRVVSDIGERGLPVAIMVREPALACRPTAGRRR